MANLTFNQIADLLNDVMTANSELSESNATLDKDLSNIVDFGKAVTEGSIDWSTTADALMNKITRQVILRTDFVPSAPDIYVESNDWAGVTEVYRVLLNGLTDSNFFDPVTADSDAGTYYRNDADICSKLFGIEMPTVKSKYFEKTLTYLKSVTIAPTQFANAFISAQAMSQFINEIWNKVSEQWEFAKDTLSYLAFDIAIVKAISDRATFSGTTCTACPSIILKDWSTPDELYRVVMGLMRKFKQYNNFASAEDYISSVTDDNLVCYMRADLYDSIIPILSELTMNKSAVSSLIDKFKPITSWTGKGTDDDIELDGTAVDDTTTKGTYSFAVRNIDYVIMDKRFVCCTADNKKVTSQYNPLTDTTNYFHTAILKYRVNSELPLIVECDCDTIGDAVKLTSISAPAIS